MAEWTDKKIKREREREREREDRMKVWDYKRIKINYKKLCKYEVKCVGISIFKNSIFITCY